MFFKKENELDFSCQSCGNCCKYFDINITHLDIERILKNRPDLIAKDFVSFIQADTNKDTEKESFISTYGRREIALKKKKETKSCVFLNENNMCSIHDFKPLVCRVWPFSYEKGKISWIDEHRDFIKHTCKHIYEKGANDPDKLKDLIKEHYKERKIYSKFVKIWNDEKEKDLIKDELFSNILDEDFLEFILKETKLKEKSEIEAKEEDTFYSEIISFLTKDRRVEAVLSSEIKNFQLNKNNLDLSLLLYIREENLYSFIDIENIKKIKDTLNYESFFIEKNTIKFLDKENKIIVLNLISYNELKLKQSFDTKIIYNSSNIEINKFLFEEEKKENLEKIYYDFHFKIQECLINIKKGDFFNSNLILNSLINKDLLELNFWYDYPKKYYKKTEYILIQNNFLKITQDNLQNKLQELVKFFNDSYIFDFIEEKNR